MGCLCALRCDLDFYHLPLDPKQGADLENQYMELLFEQSPGERSEGHDSLADAIAAHVASFADFWAEGWDGANTNDEEAQC